MDLKKIVLQGESETLEFKKSLSESKEITKTISAFANTKGGRIFIGVSNQHSEYPRMNMVGAYCIRPSKKDQS